MESILLKFNKAAFIQKAKYVPDKETLALVNERVEEAKSIALNIQGDASKIPSPQEEIKRAQKKFIGYKLQEVSIDDFTPMECYLFSLYISEFSENEEDSACIVEILEHDENWNELFIRPLCSFVMTHWHGLESSDMYQPIYDFFYQKIVRYRGNSSYYQDWREQCNYFKQEVSGKTGPYKLGRDLKKNGQSILLAPEKLGFPSDFIHDEYYQDAIIAYYEDVESIPEDIEEVLAAHNNKDTNKLVIANLINGTTSGPARIRASLLEQRTSLQYLAMKYVGHPSEPGLWDLIDYNPDDRKFIKDAAQTLNHWLIEQYIEEIFSKFINDPKRKRFWLKYAKAHAIDSVQIVGQVEVRQKLERIESLRESLTYCFYLARQRHLGQCAFIMKIRGCNFVEFSDLGSVYVYRDDSWINNFKKWNENNGVSIRLLKNTSLDNGVDWDDDFKINHTSGWEQELSEFIKDLR